jgi:hypothetical protein
VPYGRFQGNEARWPEDRGRGPGRTPRCSCSRRSRPGDAGLDAAAPHPEASWMVVAAVIGGAERPLAVDRPPELSAPDDERIVQQAARRERRGVLLPVRLDRVATVPPCCF